MSLSKEETAIPDLELALRYMQSGEVYYAGALYQRHTQLNCGLCLKYFKNTELLHKEQAVKLLERLRSGKQ